jgi:hypothetical protein
LLMLEIDTEDTVRAGQLSPIDWDRLQDNASEEKVRWLFLKDIQNKFTVDRKWWLLKQISYEKWLKRE